MIDPRYVNESVSPSLTPVQVVTLVRIMEECSEIQQAAAKALRFGLRPTSVVDGKEYDNLRDIEEECTDLKLVLLKLREVTK